jgi:hypothetical protein
MATQFPVLKSLTGGLRTALGLARVVVLAACGFAVSLGAGCAPAPSFGEERLVTYGPTANVSDPFARLRGSAVAPGLDAWQYLGEQLARLELLEGAVYDEPSGLLLLIGKPAAGRGPYHLDDLMVALQAVYFEKEPLGMTIDPDPQNPRGPTMNVQYFGGCADSALGWIMFECDRLVKCYSQGLDNFTGQAFAANVPEFYNMLQLRAGSKQGADSTWNRFWLTLDLEQGPRWHENPTSSNGFQPVVCETEDRHAMWILHCRLFLRTEVMRMTNGELVPVADAEDKQARRFASHFSHFYDKFAEVRPEFARLQALARLLVLAEWLDRARIPLDRDVVRGYQQQVRVETPRQTLARTNTLQVKEQEGDLIAVHEYSVYGGVDADPHTFFANDKDSRAARLATVARGSLDGQPDQWSWQATTADGPVQIIGLPTVKTRLDQMKVSKHAVEFRPPRDSEQPPPAALPTTEMAESERGPSVVGRAQIDLTTIDQARENIRGPPSASDEQGPQVNLVLVDERGLAQSERQALVGREAISLFLQEQQKAHPVRGPPDQSPEAKRTAGFSADSERGAAPVGREPILLKRMPRSPSATPRGPPAAPFTAESERATPVGRQLVDLNNALPLGLPVFETSVGRPTWNVPRLRSHTNPRRQLVLTDPRQPERKFAVPDQLVLQSELGDILVSFGGPEFDETRREFFFSSEDGARWGITGYYPDRSSLEFNDGMRLKFSPSGWPQYAQMSDGSSVNFLYDETPSSEPQLAACVVSLLQTPEESGYYRLPQIAQRASSVVSPAPLPVPEKPNEVETYSDNTTQMRVHEKPDEVETPTPPLEKQEFRTWTDRTGRTVEAVLESSRDGVAILRTRTGLGHVPINRLSTQDQDYIRLWAAAREKSRATKPP